MTVHNRPAASSGGRRCRRDRGSATVEMLAALPLVLAAVCFAVFCGRIAVARIDVDAAASAAARAASIQRSPAAAGTAAQASATQALAGQGVTCTQLSTVVDTSRFTPGGAVTVTITCTLTVADLIGLGTPGQVTVTGIATSPIDTWRADSLGFANSEALSGGNRSGGGGT